MEEFLETSQTENEKKSRENTYKSKRLGALLAKTIEVEEKSQ